MDRFDSPHALATDRPCALGRRASIAALIAGLRSASIAASITTTIITTTGCGREVTLQDPRAAPAASAVATPSGAHEAGVVAVAAPSADPAAIDALLRFAFEVASRIPEDPHARDRAKTQEWCASAALACGNGSLAAEFVQGMRGWRRAAAYAELARWHAGRGDEAEARRFAELALSLVPEQRDWQQERTRVKVAQAYAELGALDEAERLERGVGEAERGKVDAVRSARADAAAGDAQLDEAARMIGTLNVDLVRNAGDLLVALYARFSSDDVRRARIEELVERALKAVPYDVQVRALLRLAEAAHDAGRDADARGFLARAAAVCELARWQVEDGLVQKAAVARAYAECGDSARARQILAAARAEFDASREAIIDVFRARPLRAIAAASLVAGEREGAVSAFTRAVEEGAVNPNARPRAEDLAATAAAMAEAGFVPDAALDARMRAIAAGLVAPW